MTAYVTGSAAVSSIGPDADSCFRALLAGASGLHPLRVFNREQFGVQQSYEIDDRPDGIDRTRRAGALLANAVTQAVHSAGLESLAGVPIIVGTGLGELRSAELAYLNGDQLPPDQLRLSTALNGLLGADDILTISNACAASLYALGLALDLITLGRHRHVVVGGVDVLTASMFGLLDRVHNDPPDRVRPFDTQRKGVVMGEGAAAVVVSAKPAELGATGSRSEAESQIILRAVALGCDAFHVTAPDPDGMERAIRDGHRAAGIRPADVDVIYAHGTGTVLNDSAEALALSRVFDTTRPVVAAVKGATGHTSGGSGLFSVTMAIRSLQRSVVPGVHGLTEPIRETTGFAISAANQELTRARVAQVNAFGFGGLNAVAMLQRVDLSPGDLPKTNLRSVEDEAAA